MPDNGIYSGYIGPQCISNGRISIKVTAFGLGGKIRLMSGYPSAASPDSNIFIIIYNINFIYYIILLRYMYIIYTL